MLGPYPWACFHYRGAANPLPAYHRHNEVELTFLYGGRMTYELEGRRAAIPDRSLCVFWGGIPHRCTNWAKGGGIRVICLPMTFFLRARLPHAFLKDLLSGKVVQETDAKSSAWDERQMQVWERDLLRHDPTRLSIVESEIESRLRRLALAETGNCGRAEAGGDALSRLLGILCAHANEPITVSEMATMAGLHPKYACRLFKRNLGITSLEFVHRLRVSHAQRLLADTNLRVAEVAFESGFNSASQFYEAFQQICGESPGRFRRRKWVPDRDEKASAQESERSGR